VLAVRVARFVCEKDGVGGDSQIFRVGEHPPAPRNLCEKGMKIDKKLQVSLLNLFGSPQEFLRISLCLIIIA